MQRRGLQIAAQARLRRQQIGGADVGPARGGAGARSVVEMRIEAELAEARTSAAQLARVLSAEQARRETLEAQQAELRRSL